MTVDMTGVKLDQTYRLTEDGRMLDGCARCQDGAHWECHGCSCPCTEAPYFHQGPQAAAWRNSIEAIGRTITRDQRDEQWRLRELADITALVESESARGML